MDLGYLVGVWLAGVEGDSGVGEIEGEDGEFHEGGAPFDEPRSFSMAGEEGDCGGEGAGRTLQHHRM